ncbi:MAG: ABC transporter substrate-binding protein [Balneolaceae bacterium]
MILRNIKAVPNLLFISFISFVLFSSCSSSDVTVVEDRPQRGEQAEREAPPAEEDPQAVDFRDFRIGIVGKMQNLDPLFAENIATLNAISLIYEGLFKLDESGEPVPVLVSDFEISDDSLTYTFRIRNNVFFHDSEAFSAGIGRRLVSSDVKYAFERTAHMAVPPVASRLFMNIEGYELYYNEQRYLYDSSLRILKGVTGIHTPDNQTVVISLREPDSDFLHKLSSPYAVIYPGEAVRSEQVVFAKNPVGTGKYTFNRFTGEDDIVLTYNQKHWAEDVSFRDRFNRIDIKTYETEGKLFQEFARKEVDLISDPGIETRKQILNSAGSLITAYQDIYKLIHNTGTRKGYLAFNPTFDGDIQPLLRAIQASENVYEKIEIFGLQTLVSNRMPELQNNGELPGSYLTPFTENPYIRKILLDLSRNLIEPQSNIRLMDVRIPNSFTALKFLEMDHFHYERVTDLPEKVWFEYTLDTFSLAHNYVTGIKSNGVAWWTDLSSIRLDDKQRAGL